MGGAGERDGRRSRVSRYRTLLVVAFLAVATAAIYGGVGDFGYVALDDGPYVFENPVVLRGLTWEGVRWAFTTFHASNWHPLTWLSHMLDVELFGADPGWHHRGNVILHALNSIVLFLVLGRMTGGWWESGFAAALFAVHPLHVESVAWVAERKDLLSAFFWILAMGAYTRYARDRRLATYLPVCACFVLGLLSKPMAVTLPFALLLLDWWPLGRFTAGNRSAEGGASFSLAALRPLVLEKVPLLAFSAASCWVTFVAQREGGSVVPTDVLPLDVRVGNALVSYGKYIVKTIWPSSLSVFYPLNNSLPRGMYVLGAILLLSVVTALLIRQARWRPYLIVGWLWFLGTLVPVIGLVQVGVQAMADRYTYIPLIGLFILAAWGAKEALPEGGLRWRAGGLAGCAVLGAFLIASGFQANYWKNTITLFRHALDVTRDNWVAHFLLGNALLEAGSVDEAVSQFAAGLRIRPDDSEARRVFAMALGRHGRQEESIRQFQILAESFPEDPVARTNLGVALEKGKRYREAEHELREAIRLRPDLSDARSNLGMVLLSLGRKEEAAREFREALRINPGDPWALEGVKEVSKRGRKRGRDADG